VRIDLNGQIHPDLSDLPTIAGIMHMATCQECLLTQMDKQESTNDKSYE
jgi:hypothetical protein